LLTYTNHCWIIQCSFNLSNTRPYGCRERLSLKVARCVAGSHGSGPKHHAKNIETLMSSFCSDLVDLVLNTMRKTLKHSCHFLLKCLFFTFLSKLGTTKLFQKTHWRRNLLRFLWCWTPVKEGMKATCTSHLTLYPDRSRVDSYLYLTIDIVSLYVRGGKLFISDTWNCIFIGHGCTITCISKLELYLYRSRVYNYLYLKIGIVSL
jgi:hypothetical protein